MSRGGAKLVWPLAIVGVGGLGLAAMVALRPEVKPEKPPEIAPLVRVVEAFPRSHRYVVRTHGTVRPRTQSDLIPQVAGEVLWVSPQLVSGGFFRQGEPLVRLDTTDTVAELERARAALARAESELQHASTELARQRRLGEEGATSRARIDDAETAHRVAEAVLRQARAQLERAERDLERTELRAPYTGRVRSERVDVGQFVSRGETIATLYAVDAVEVALPIPDRELRYLDAPLGMAPGGTAEVTPAHLPVRLHARFAGEPHTWNGHVVRSEGEIDAKSRMVNLVARVEDPYGLHGDGERPPLAVGLFVEAEILGREVTSVYVLPRRALREGDPMDREDPDRVHVVSPEERLELRPVAVLRTEREHVVIGQGLSPGERVSLSSLETAVEGMRVRVASDAGTTPPRDAAALGSPP